MNKHTVSVSPSTNLSGSEAQTSTPWVDLARSRRLIVLIPPDSDCMRVTRRICKLAGDTNSDIQLLGLCRDPEQEMALRRELVTVSALIRDAKVYVEMKVEVGSNWPELVRRNYQDGDRLVCIADQRIGIRRRPLSEILESTLEAPIYVLSEAAPTQSRASLLSQVTAWSGFIGIITGFFILQVKVSQLPKDGFQTLLLILLLIPEFWLIWVWNSLFS